MTSTGALDLGSSPVTLCLASTHADAMLQLKAFSTRILETIELSSMLVLLTPATLRTAWRTTLL